MAFLRYANAAIVKPLIQLDDWIGMQGGPKALTRTAATTVLQKYDPNEFLLTHCTIIASVDTEESNAPHGRQMVDGYQIDRQYSDWLVTPDTQKYINNNNDCWERKLLLSSFKSFVGGENYVEHVQIPELSKGKIIDAASRDIGDSIYVDILVATAKKHRSLIAAIESKRLSTLSMGCSVAFTICTRCGNVAEDEAQMCPHIKYAKGNEWIDELGKKRKISELCGHFSAEPGSVKFIEASWVANPAFKGAVLRSILTAEDVAQISKSTGTRMQVAFNAPVRTADPNQLQRAANFRNPARYPRQVVLAQDEFDMGQAGVEPAAPATPAEKPDPLGKAVDSLVEAIREKAIEKVRGELGTDEAKRIHDTKENTNNTLVKEAARNPEWLRIAKVVASNVPKTAATKILSGLMLHKNGGWRSVVASQRFDGREMLVVSRLLDVLSGKPRIAGESRIYRTVMVVGGPSSYPTIGRFLQACRDQIQRPLTDHESRLLVQKGRIYELGTR